jgi:indole-3-glycerol phosphate synthase
VLHQIVDDVRSRLPGVIDVLPSLETRAASAPPPRDLAAALRSPGLSVIAEIKRASPSRGALNLDLDPAARARSYEAGGAAALSVLTEPDHFLARQGDLQAARSAVAIPTLRKDFTLHRAHVVEARAMGADAVLLIAAILDDADLTGLLAESARWGMAALVEVHDEHEAVRAVRAGAAIVGVNNRDLATFDIDLATSERLAPLLADVEVRVGESGILGPADADRMVEAGFDAVLVGEYLVKHGDPAGAIEELRQVSP